MKRLIRDAAIYFGLAIGCIVGTDYVPGVWHDVLLVVAGVTLGGVCAMVVLIKVCLSVRKATAEEEAQ